MKDMICLLLFAGLFMGWSLGTKDAANAFGTTSRRVMMPVGSSIADISQMEGFLVIIGMALTVVIMGNWMLIPVSTSQAVVGAVIGAGLTRGVKSVHFGVLKNIALAWVNSPHHCRIADLPCCHFFETIFWIMYNPRKRFASMVFFPWPSGTLHSYKIRLWSN